MLTIRLLHAIAMLKIEIGACKKKKNPQNIKSRIFQFYPTFDVIFECIPSSKMQKTFVLQFILG